MHNQLGKTLSITEFLRVLRALGPCGILVLDSNGVIAECEWCEELESSLGHLMELDVSGAIGMTWPEFRDQHPEFQHTLIELDEGGSAVVVRPREDQTAPLSVLSEFAEYERLEQRSTQWLRHAETLSNIGFFDWDIQNNSIEWSEGLYRIYGLDPSSFGATLQAFMERVVPEDREQVQQAVQEAIAQCGNFSSVERIRTGSGEIRHLESCGRVLPDENGNPVRLIGVCRDVTIAKRSMETQSRQIEGLKLLANSASELMAGHDELEWVEMFKKMAVHLDCDGFANYRFENNQLELWASHGFPDDVIEPLRIVQLGECICGIAAQDRVLMYAPHELLKSHPHGQDLYNMGVRAHVSLPLIYDERLLGTLAFTATRRSSFEDFEIDFMNTVGQLVAAAMARMYYENEISEREQRFRAFAENTTDALFIHDLEGRFVDVNLQACESLGYSRKELLQLNVRDIEIESDVSVIGELAKSRGTLLEGRHQRKDGSSFRVEVSAKGITYGGQKMVLACARDISARLESERKRKQAEETNQRILQQARMVTWEAQPLSLDFSFLNGPCEELLGFKRDEWMKPGFWRRHLHPEDTDWAANVIGDGVGNNRHEFRMRHSDGRFVWIEASVEVVPPGGNGSMPGLRGVLTEITSRKELEEQLRYSQKMEAIGRLAGGVAHDFNNLLTVISTSSELIRMQNDSDSENSELVKSIQDAADRASSLTRQLLLVGQKSVNSKKFVELNDVVEQSRRLLQRVIGEDIKLSAELQSGLPQIRANRSHLDQVILNLAVNSRDAMPDGGTLTLATSMKTIADTTTGLEPGEYVELVVADTGGGIPKEIRSKIFEPFVTTKSAGYGTGLGLAVVYGVVQECGGRISINSEISRGTQIQILFPVSAESESEPTVKSESSSQTGSGRILVVEDDDMVRQSTCTILKRNGYEVHEANGAKQAWKLESELDGSFELLLTDLVMPGIGGLELADYFRKRYPRIRVLCMSGYSNEKVDQADSDFAFIQKPFSVDALVSTVNGLLNRSRA